MVEQPETPLTRQQLEVQESVENALDKFHPNQAIYQDGKPLTPPPRDKRRNPRALIVAASRVRVNPDQVRQQDKEATSERVKELANSIRSVGLQQPPGVRETSDGMYEVVYGEGRFVAMTQILGWEEIEVIRVDAHEKDLLWHQLHENVHRTNLNALDLAAAVDQAKAQGYSMSQIAERMCKSETWVQKLLTIAKNLSLDAREIVEAAEHRPEMETMYSISQVPESRQAEVASQVVEQKLSRKDTQELATRLRKEAGPNESQKRTGRKKKTKGFEQTFRSTNGATIAVKFRRADVTEVEVKAALREFLLKLEGDGKIDAEMKPAA